MRCSGSPSSSRTSRAASACRAASGRCARRKRSNASRAAKRAATSSRRAEPGMVVQTDSERVRTSRRLVLELLGSSVDLSTAPAALEYIERYDARPERLEGARVSAGLKVDNELYVRDYSKCILCY